MRQLHFATAPDGATPRNTKHKLPPYKHLVIAVGDCDTPVVWVRQRCLHRREHMGGGRRRSHVRLAASCTVLAQDSARPARLTCV